MSRPAHTLAALAAATALVAGGAVAFADAPIGRRAPASAMMRKLERQAKARGRPVTHKPIPTVSQVGLPAYPRSWYLQSMPRGKLAEVDLVAPAPPKKVAAFYQKALAGKGYKAHYEAAAHLHVFQKGGKLSQWFTMAHPAVWVEPVKCDTGITTYFSKKLCGKKRTMVKIFVPGSRIPDADMGMGG